MAVRMVVLDEVRESFAVTRGRVLPASDVLRLVRSGKIEGERRGGRWYICERAARELIGERRPVPAAKPRKRAAASPSKPPSKGMTPKVRVANPKRTDTEEIARIEQVRSRLLAIKRRRAGCRHIFQRPSRMMFRSAARAVIVPNAVVNHIAKEGLLASEIERGQAYLCRRCFCSDSAQRVFGELWPVMFRDAEPERIKPVNDWREYQVFDKACLDELPDSLSGALTRMYYARKRPTRNGEVLTEQEMLALWRRCAGRCELTGQLFDLGPVGGRRPNRPSIDRIDASRGYEYENCRIVTYQVNLALSDFGDDAFAAMCHAYVAKHPA